MYAYVLTYLRHRHLNLRRHVLWQIVKDSKPTLVDTILFWIVILAAILGSIAGCYYAVVHANSERRAALQKLDKTERVVAGILRGGVIIDGELHLVTLDNTHSTGDLEHNYAQASTKEKYVE